MDFLSDVMFWREALTVLSFALFLSISLWAYGSRQKDVFQEISLAVVNDDEAVSPALARIRTGSAKASGSIGWYQNESHADSANSITNGGSL